MKRLTMLMGAVALTMALACSKASADFALTVTGSAMVQSTDGAVKATTSSLSFNNKQIYNIISNGVANAGQWSAVITPATLPANGYIAFNPDTNDGTVQGIFYVTNKSGFYFPLSGYDQNDEYYSWIELDTQNSYFEYNDVPLTLGWVNQFVGDGGPFNGVAAYSINTKGSGTETETSTALLYIHDDPYSYDDADNPNIFWNNFMPQGEGDDLDTYNGNAVEIRGVLAATLTVTSSNSVPVITSKSFSLTGTGNLMLQGWYAIIVKTGTAKFAK
jgi:hypothetical protein